MPEYERVGALTNKNVSWMQGKALWSFCVAMIVIYRLILYVLPIVEQQYAWTVVFISTTVITFYFIHWVKGTPFTNEDGGEYNAQTFWEQIDDGRQYTATRKFLTLLPIFMCYLALSSTSFSSSSILLNVPFLVLNLVPKLGLMHGTRIMGINKD